MDVGDLKVRFEQCRADLERFYFETKRAIERSNLLKEAINKRHIEYDFLKIRNHDSVVVCFMIVYSVIIMLCFQMEKVPSCDVR